jgi:glycosyltransferase involved in cell wall biosynthesis
VRVAVDLTSLLPTLTGVDVYLKELLIHLGRIDRDNAYWIFTNYEDRRVFENLLPQNFRIIARCLRPRIARLLFQQGLLPVAARTCDVVHSPSFLMPAYRGRQKHVLTVHDMTFFSLPDVHTRLRRSLPFRLAILRSIERADRVIAPSAATRAAILGVLPRLDPDRIRVIPHGVAQDFHPRQPDEVKETAARLRLPSRYILHVGTIEPRKNLSHLLEAYRSLLQTGTVAEDLVLAGRLGWDYKPLLRLLEAPELRERVHFIGYVQRDDLPGLYAGARLFVCPSLQEGFGFPALEAMASGVPTIASLSSSLAENLHDAAELVPLADVQVLAAAMKRLLFDDELRAHARERGLARAAEFSWEQTARATLQCYQELAAGDA